MRYDRGGGGTELRRLIVCLIDDSCGVLRAEMLRSAAYSWTYLPGRRVAHMAGQLTKLPGYKPVYAQVMSKELELLERAYITPVKTRAPSRPHQRAT